MQGWTALLSTLAGAVAAWAGIGLTHWLGDQRKRRSIAAACAAELSGLARLITDYRWIEQLGNFERLCTPGRFFIAEKPIPVFDAHVGDFGLFPPDLTRQVMRTYLDLRSAFEGFNALKYLSEHWPADLTPGQRDEVQSATRVTRNLVEEVLISINRVVPLLEKESRRIWPEEETY